MVENQTYLFIVFSLTGIGLGVLFDFFRALRKTFKTPDLVTYLEDIIYWILAGIIVLYNIWFFNDGEIRIYMILGILIGAVIYTLTLSTIFIKINYFIMIIKDIKKICILPMIWCIIWKKIVIYQNHWLLWEHHIKEWEIMVHNLIVYLFFGGGKRHLMIKEVSL